MLARVQAASLSGLDARPVELEIDMAKGIPGMTVVGLPDAAVRESRERVRTALRQSGYRLPAARFTVNLAPADVRKEGPRFDLPLAVGLLVATGQLSDARLADYQVVGELSLDGSVRPVRGVLAIALDAARRGVRGLIVPAANGAEAAAVRQLEVIPVDRLEEAVGFLQGTVQLQPRPACQDPGPAAAEPAGAGCFSDVRGQPLAKRALLVAAAGRHNAVMVGAPGSGKTMLARRTAGLLPRMPRSLALEVTRIYSVAGYLRKQGGLVWQPPFRAPHHTTSYAGMVGGGSPPGPGEVTLAHGGMLFLDELPEFQRRTLEVLRQPLERGSVTISRATARVTFPARFLLVAAMNPCPCGYATAPGARCTCSTTDVHRYRSRISGPLLDRFDLHLDVQPLEPAALLGPATGPTSAELREQVLQARRRQATRWAGREWCTNGGASGRALDEVYGDQPKLGRLLVRSMRELGLSARAYDRVRRVALTLADLDGRDSPEEADVLEALQYRTLDRGVMAA